MSTIKKESELPKVTNLNDDDSIRITLADGRSGSIKKTDLIPSMKDAIGQLLGNSDPLSLFTNVIVNNGGVLGKATIENLASVVSGAYIKNMNTNIDDLKNIPFQYGYFFDDINSLYGMYISLSSHINSIQVFIGYNNSFCRIRSYDLSNQKWTDWHNIY